MLLLETALMKYLDLFVLHKHSQKAEFRIKFLSSLILIALTDD